MDDHNLGRLIADTPSRCILLLEDIDCAFPSRDDDDEEEVQVDAYGNPVYQPGYTPRMKKAGRINTAYIIPTIKFCLG